MDKFVKTYTVIDKYVNTYTNIENANNLISINSHGLAILHE